MAILKSGHWESSYTPGQWLIFSTSGSQLYGFSRKKWNLLTLYFTGNFFSYYYNPLRDLGQKKLPFYLK